MAGQVVQRDFIGILTGAAGVSVASISEPLGGGQRRTMSAHNRCPYCWSPSQLEPGHRFRHSFVSEEVSRNDERRADRNNELIGHFFAVTGITALKDQPSDAIFGQSFAAETSEAGSESRRYYSDGIAGRLHAGTPTSEGGGS